MQNLSARWHWTIIYNDNSGKLSLTHPYQLFKNARSFDRFVELSIANVIWTTWGYFTYCGCFSSKGQLMLNRDSLEIRDISCELFIRFNFFNNASMVTKLIDRSRKEWTTTNDLIRFIPVRWCQCTFTFCKQQIRNKLCWSHSDHVWLSILLSSMKYAQLTE